MLAVRLWLAVSDTLWLELRELTKAVVLTDTLAHFVSAGVADQVMLELNDELTAEDELGVGVAV